jgi:hypothetical protein
MTSLLPTFEVRSQRAQRCRILAGVSNGVIAAVAKKIAFLSGFVIVVGVKGSDRRPSARSTPAVLRHYLASVFSGGEAGTNLPLLGGVDGAAASAPPSPINRFSTFAKAGRPVSCPPRPSGAATAFGAPAREIPETNRASSHGEGAYQIRLTPALIEE